jgi:hypothetical protein
MSFARGASIARPPRPVLLWNDNEYPLLTSAVERAIPSNVRAATRPADLVRTQPDTAWCMTRPGDTYIVYSMVGRAVQLDLSTVGGSYSVAWIDQSGGTAQASRQAVSGGRIVTLEPPAALAGKPGRLAVTKRLMNGVHDMRRGIIVSASRCRLSSGGRPGRSRHRETPPRRRPAVRRAWIPAA